ncbi:MAG: D-alanyl-D-alanine carboxypeptidase [Gammaproteobacteria bacterium]|nr:D-alanyl-D-alanine carboxypeptidase [Gammaproteobacteria bacterium]
MGMFSRFCLFAALALATLLAAAEPVSFPGVPAPPQVAARQFILMDFESGAILAEQAPDERAEPASLTKIMTAYGVADALAKNLVKLTDIVTISEKAWKTEGSRMFIEVNKQVSVDDLLHGMMIQSGNDAAVALAEHVSGSEEVFTTVMNQHAARLGLTNTKYANAEGLPDPNNYATPRDLAKLTQAFIRDYPEIYKYYSQKEFTFNGIHQPNRNGLLGKDPSVDGVKTGHTEAAGYCLISSAKRENMRLIAVVLGTESNSARTKASEALLNYGFRYFETRELYPAGAKIATARVWKGAAPNVDVVLEAPLGVTIPRGKYASVKASAEVNPRLVAPLAKGQQLGRLIVRYEDKEFLTVPLVAAAAVDQGSFLSRGIDHLRLMIGR